MHKKLIKNYIILRKKKQKPINAISFVLGNLFENNISNESMQTKMSFALIGLPG